MLALPAPPEPSPSTREQAAPVVAPSDEARPHPHLKAASKRVEIPRRHEEPLVVPLERSARAGRRADAGKLTLERMVEAARAWFDRVPGGTGKYCHDHGLNETLTNAIVTEMVLLMGEQRARGFPSDGVKAKWDALTPQERLDLAMKSLERNPRGLGTARSGATSTE